MRIKFKEIIFIIISFIFSVLFWYFLKIVIYQEFLFKNLILTAVFILFAAITSLINFVLIKNKSLFLFNCFLLLFPFLLFYPFNFLYLISAILGVIVIFVGYLSVQSLEKSQIKINFSQLIKKSIPYYFNSVLLIVLVIFYFSPIAQNVDKFQMPQFLFDYIFSFSEPIINNYVSNLGLGNLNIKNLNLEKSVDELIFDIYSQSLGVSKISYQQSIKIPAVASLIKEQRDFLSKQIGIKIRTNDRPKDIIYQYLNIKIKDLGRQNPLYFRLALILILFSVLKIIILPLKYISIILTLIVLKLLLLFKVFGVERQMVEKEVLTV